MKLTKQQEAALMQVYETWWTSYLNGDTKTYDSFLADDYHFVGSTNGEEYLNRKETTAFFGATAEQLAGKAELRKVKRSVEELDGGLILITDLADGYVASEPEWVFYSRFRFTSLLKETKNGWRFIYQHFSAPDTKAQEGETIGMQQITKENEELRDAIKRRTIELEHKNRELEIEAAVERVRAEAMAMHSTEDFSKVSRQLLQQVKNLSLKGFTGATIYLVDENDFFTCYDFSSFGNMGDARFQLLRYDANKFPLLGSYPLSQWKKGEPYFELDYDIKKLRAGAKEFEEINVSLADSLKEALATGHLTHQWDACGRLSNGFIAFDMTSPPDEDVRNITIKMTHAFDQAYTRFLDLQKAEAQAREAQIEAALERTRTQSMLMQHSHQLDETLRVFHEQVLSLGIASEFSFLWLPDEEKDRHIFWAAWKEDNSHKSKAVNYPMDRNDPATAQCLVDWKANKPIVAYEVKPTEVPGYFATWQELIEGTAHLKPENFSNGLYYVEAYMKYGCFGVMVEDQMSEEQHKILYRIAVEFERTYTRFLDLQKAEAQAREAQIEAALERVRSRSMAMHKSEELADLSLELVKQVQALGVSTWFCAFNINDEDGDGSMEWGSNGLGTFPKYRTPREGIFLRYYNAGQKGETLLVNEIGEDQCPAHYEYLCSLPGVGEQLLGMKAEGIPFPTSQIDHVAYFKYGYIIFISYEPVPEAHDVFKRFARVFEQTYTRFLDLQKAEAQAREAQIEAALERVRSRTMGMQQSTEIGDVAAELFNQMNLLVTNLWTCGFVLCEKDRNEDEWWLSMDTGLTRGFMLPNVGDYTHATLYEGWEKREAFRAVQLDGNDLQEHYKWLMNLPVAKSIFEEMDAAGLERPDWQKLHAAYFSKGYLVLITREPCSEEEIFKRFAQVFDQTYTRFLDLKKAEAQAREAQIEAALEKVRSRSLAMQKTEELQEVVAVVAEKLQELGVILDANGVIICTYFPDSKDVLHWMASEDFSHSGSYLLPYFDHPIFNAAWESKISGDEYFSKSFTKEEKDSFFEYAFAHSDYRKFPDEFKQWIFQNDKHSLSFAWAKNSALLLPSHTGILPSEADQEILKRFSRVFEQAYIRFMDLKKAEQLATQAQIDLENLIAAKKKTEEALTELKATQSQLIQAEKMASLGELTAGIAHEIQNPLNFVNNFSEVSNELLDEMMTAASQGDFEEVKEILNDVKQNLEKINHHGKRADGIVKGMLQHSKSSSGTKEPTDINALADEYLRLAYHGLRAKDKSFNATLETDYDTSLQKLPVIPQDMGRVILNLITNAFYVVSEKKRSGIDGYEPKVKVSTKSTDGKVEIHVKDNGSGIPQNVIDKIFQPFFTTKPTGQGTGLGLSLSYDIVKAHGGELKVETKEGGGSTFIIHLPIA